jgi:hypothetical protein
MLSDTPPERDVEWTDAGAEGCWRFVQRKVNTTQGTEGIAVEPDASVTRYNFNLVARYELSNIHTGAVLDSGTETTLSEYDVVSSPYSTLVAQQAAQQRATEDIANRIRIDLAVFFHNKAR